MAGIQLALGPGTEGAGKRLKIRETRVVFGRASSCTVQLVGKRASREHAVLEICDGAWTVRDLGSRNGVFLNGQRVRAAKVRQGDLIVFGRKAAQVKVLAMSPAAPAETRAAPRPPSRPGVLPTPPAAPPVAPPPLAAPPAAAPRATRSSRKGRGLAILAVLLVLGLVGALILLSGLEEDEADLTRLAPLDPARVVVDPRLKSEVVRDRVLVTLHPGVTAADLKRVLAGLGFEARIVGGVPAVRMLQVDVPPDRLHEARFRLRSHPYVAAAGYDHIIRPRRTYDDPALANRDLDDWGLARIRAYEAWDVTTGGAIVGVIDEGFVVGHEELSGKVRDPFSLVTDSASMQVGPVASSGMWMGGHGTHVAVTAVGLAGNGVGTAGVAPDSPLVPVQVLGIDDGTGAVIGDTAMFVAGIVRTLEAGAVVVNMSLGEDVPEALQTSWLAASSDADRQAIEEEIVRLMDPILDGYAAAIDLSLRKGAPIVRASGNQALPARFDPLSLSRRCISVAATSSDDARYEWSNWGEFITVSAPGVQVWSAWPPVGGYDYLDGTSMAAPHVTGVIALMKSVKKDLTFEEIRAVLVETGTRLDGTDRPIGPLVDARAAVDAVKRRKEEGTPPPEPEPPLLPDPPADPTAEALAPEGVAILERPDPWNHPDVQRLIDLWLSIATPPLPPENGPWFYDKFGRALNNRNVFAAGSPDWAARRHAFLWGLAKKYDSVAHGTLYEFVTGMLASGTFDPAPSGVPGAKPSGGESAGGGPEDDGQARALVVATTPRELFDLASQAFRERRLETIYDLTSRRGRRELTGMMDELVDLIRSAEGRGEPPEKVREALATFGVSSVEELERLDTRTKIYRMGRGLPDEFYEQNEGQTFVRADLDPGERSGTIHTRGPGDRTDEQPIVLEDGGWRLDVE